MCGSDLVRKLPSSCAVPSVCEPSLSATASTLNPKNMLPAHSQDADTATFEHSWQHRGKPACSVCCCLPVYVLLQLLLLLCLQQPLALLAVWGQRSTQQEQPQAVHT